MCIAVYVSSWQAVLSPTKNTYSCTNMCCLISRAGRASLKCLRVLRLCTFYKQHFSHRKFRTFQVSRHRPSRLQFYFAFFNGFSGQIFFLDWLPMLYNAVFTSWHCLFTLYLEKDVNFNYSFRYP